MSCTCITVPVRSIHPNLQGFFLLPAVLLYSSTVRSDGSGWLLMPLELQVYKVKVVTDGFCFYSSSCVHAGRWS